LIGVIFLIRATRGLAICDMRPWNRVFFYEHKRVMI
jgi:hypothetical protein